MILDYPDHKEIERYQPRFYQKLENISSVYMVDPNNSLHISQAVFDCKHIQRLFMSATSLAPDFLFIENKETWTLEDVAGITQAFDVAVNDMLVFKKNHETQGQGNFFIPAKDLGAFLNSSVFQKNFSGELVILIEQAKNSLINNHYETHRYCAAFTTDEDFFCTDVYKESHPHLDSHRDPVISWLNAPLDHQESRTEIQQLLKRIQNTDYRSLIIELLASNYKIQQLLAFEFLQKPDIFKLCFKKYQKEQDHLIIPAKLLDILGNLALSEDNKIRKLGMDLVYLIKNHAKDHLLVNSVSTSGEVLARIEQIVLASKAKRMELKVKPPLTVATPDACRQNNPLNLPFFNKIDSSSTQIEKFFNALVYGNQAQVEKILQTNFEILLERIDLQDLSGRNFSDITAFKYALWALDTRFMCPAILKALPNTEEGDGIRKNLRLQYLQLEAQGIRYSLNGKTYTEKYYDFVQGLESAVDSYESLFTEENRNQEFGFYISRFLPIGQLQRLFPVHIVQHYFDGSFYKGEFTGNQLQRNTQLLISNSIMGIPQIPELPPKVFWYLPWLGLKFGVICNANGPLAAELPYRGAVRNDLENLKILRTQRLQDRVDFVTALEKSLSPECQTMAERP